MNLTTVRVMRKKTQWDIRKETGIHQTKVSLIENGYIIPNEREKEAIAKVLGVSADSIDWQETNHI